MLILLKKSEISYVQKNGQDVPLSVHSKGSFVKKIDGKQHRFGKINDPDAARIKLNAQRKLIQFGFDPESEYVSVDLNRLTINGLCQLFINEKQQLVKNQELVAETLLGYKQAM